MVEDPVHHRRAFLKHRSDLLAVHELGDRRAAVTYPPGDLLERHTVVRQQPDEAVPQLPRGPVLGVHARSTGNGGSKVATNM